MKPEKTDSDSLQSLILGKSSIKQDVYSITREVFDELKVELGEITRELAEYASESDQRIIIALNSQGDFEMQMTLAGDTVLFHMHTNVFTFPPSHMIHRNPYVMADPRNAYCGVINIYNFLTDSFRYQRLNDSGYLIGRIFINRERHFFVEGKQQLGYKFNDFSSALIDSKALRDVLETALKYILNFELYTPPYTSVQEVRLSDIQELSQNLKLQTAKRLGFRFQHDEDNSVDF
jgi:hypothetical protein